MISFFHFLIKCVVEFSGQVATGVGFFILLGGLASSIWEVSALGVGFMILGYFLMRVGD